MAVGEAMEVTLARVDTRLETLTDAHERRIHRAEKDVSAAVDKADRLHARLDQELERHRDVFGEQITKLTDAVHMLEKWQSKAAGIAVGLGALSGIAGGVVTALILRGVFAA